MNKLHLILLFPGEFSSCLQRLDGALSAASLASQLPLASEECPDSASALLALGTLQSPNAQQRPQPSWFEPKCLRRGEATRGPWHPETWRHGKLQGHLGLLGSGVALVLSVQCPGHRGVADKVNVTSNVAKMFYYYRSTYGD